MGTTVELQQVIAYIDAHLQDDFTIVALADMAGYSPWHFYRLFMEGTGTTVMTYIRARRLERAVEEMGQGRKLFDIAMDYGFETQAGFYKAFQRHFGCAPSRYRAHKLRAIHPQFDPAMVTLANMGGSIQERVIIRIFQESDVEGLWENIYSRNTPNEVKERIARYLRAYSAGQAVPLVATVDGHIIGTTYMTFDEHPMQAHICILYDLVVYPLFQRMGIARRLIAECQTRAGEHRKSLLTLSARGGSIRETAYRKLGFREYECLPHGLIERLPFFEHEHTNDWVKLFLPLNAAHTTATAEV